jgi:hypothetical protein
MTDKTLDTSLNFSSAIYSISEEGFLPSVTTVFDEAIAHQKTVSKMDELYPSVMTGNLFADPRIEDFSSYIAHTAWNILNSQGYQMNDKEVFFHSMWGQEHHKYSSMDEHIHNNGVAIVGFYFIDCPENSPHLIISDPRIGKVQTDFPEADINTISLATSKISFTPENGKLFFTNAWLPHAFTRHNNEKPIKFIHFNLSVRYKEVELPTII